MSPVGLPSLASLTRWSKIFWYSGVSGGFSPGGAQAIPPPLCHRPVKSRFDLGLYCLAT